MSQGRTRTRRHNFDSRCTRTMASVNSTEDVYQRVSRNVQLVSVAIYCVIFLFGTLGNGLVIYVTGFRMKKTVNSIWFLNLALADFLFTAFLVFLIVSVSQNYQWQFGQFMCKFCSFVNVVNMFASVFLLTAISLDRCLSIWVVVWAQNKRTVRKAQIVCAVIWTVAAGCSAPYVAFREVREARGKTVCAYSQFMDPQISRILVIFRFVVGFLVPFLVIFGSYVAIGVRARRLQKTKKKRHFRIIFSIIIAFFICWLPFHVVQFIQLKVTTHKMMFIIHIAGTLSLCLAFMNSCLNPILYVFLCDEFQKKLKQSICLVLESALADDHLSFMSSRSLSSHFMRISRKSDSAAPPEGKDTCASSKLPAREVVSEERETLSSD